MKHMLLSIVIVSVLLTGCNDTEKNLSEQERRQDYADRIIFIDTIVDIPTLQSDKPISEVMIECKVDNKIVHRSSVRYALNGTLIGADNMKLINGNEMLSTIEKNDKNQWYKRVFNNVSVINSQIYTTNDQGFIIGVDDNQAQSYQYNELQQLVHSVEFHTLEGVLLTDYEYNNSGLLSKLTRSIYPTKGGSKVASMIIEYIYTNDGKISQTKNTSELLANNLRIEWIEDYKDPDEFGNWRLLPLGEMMATVISTGEQNKKIEGGAECRRELTYF